MTATRFPGATLLVVPLAAATGCGTPFNEQIGLVGTTAPLPALTDAAPHSRLEGGQSLKQGLDRRGWRTVTVQVPRDQVAHPPTYAINFRWDHDRGPWDPAYPAAVSAVDDTPDAGQDAADGFADPFVTAGMLVWAPIDMIFLNQPWVQKRSPTEPFMLMPDRARPSVADWFDAPNKPGALRRDGLPEGP